MQVVSGWLDKPRIHFEAPPSSRVPSEMALFVEWFCSTAAGSKVLSPLTRAGIVHLYFVSIHPFEDDNGRLARTIAEKALAQGVGQPMLVSLSPTVLARRKSHYTALEAANKSSDVTEWLAWFSGIVLEAQQRTLAQVEFIIEKAKLFEKLAGALNMRQQKALLRMFGEGPEGFLGGLSARNYMTITGASQATATRDLSDLTEVGALTWTGELKGTRYHLIVPQRLPREIRISEEGKVLEI